MCIIIPIYMCVYHVTFLLAGTVTMAHTYVHVSKIVYHYLWLVSMQTVLLSVL